MTVTQLASDDPISPELVLVLSPELRAQAIARLGPPAWPKPAPRAVDTPAFGGRSTTRDLGTMLMVRILQLAVLFAAMTVLTLVLSAVAGAVP